MKILAIDPGPVESGWVIYDTNTRLPVEWHKEPNEDVLLYPVRSAIFHDVVIEMIASYGMAVSASVFETCVWIGRFYENVSDAHLMFRRDVKLHLCGQARAKDTNIVHRLYDLYGGSRSAAVGVKVNPGPLYGFKADCWQALALAITYAETKL